MRLIEKQYSSIADILVKVGLINCKSGLYFGAYI